jgi:predicted dehydrogenase
MWAGPPDYDGVDDVEEYVSGLLRTKGPTIAFEGAWAQNVGEGAMYIEFLGDKAGIRLAYGGGFVLYGQKGGALVKTETSMRKSDMFQAEIDSFAKSVCTGVKNRADIGSVIQTQQVLDAFYRSARLRREIRM